MKKKTGIIASSVAAIAVCTSMIAGSTFALFTSESKVDITVKTGKIEVTSSIGDLTVNSLNDYTQTGASVDLPNGGKAYVDENIVNLENMTPGDEVSFDISVDNSNTTVAAKYRVGYTVESGYLLADGLNITVNDEGGKYKSYLSAWDDSLESTYTVKLELPNHADSKIDDLYQGLSTRISFKVEAVQANGAVGDTAVTEALPDYGELKAVAEKGVTSVTSESELVAAVNKGGVIKVEESTSLNSALAVSKDIYLVGNGREDSVLSLAKDCGANSVMSVENLTEEVDIGLYGVSVVNEFSCRNYARAISLYNNTGVVNLNIDDSYVESEHYAINVASLNDKVNVKVTNSTLQGYCAFQTWSSNATFEFDNCELIGLNTFENVPGNDFSAMKATANSKNVKISLNNCVIRAESTQGTKEGFLTLSEGSGVVLTAENCRFMLEGNPVSAEQIANAEYEIDKDEYGYIVANDYIYAEYTLEAVKPDYSVTINGVVITLPDVPETL